MRSFSHDKRETSRSAARKINKCRAVAQLGFYFKHGTKYLHAGATHAWMGPKPQLFGAYGGSGFGYGRYFLRAGKATNAPLASHVGLTARWRKLVTAWADPQSPIEGHPVNPAQVWTMAPRP